MNYIINVSEKGLKTGSFQDVTFSCCSGDKEVGTLRIKYTTEDSLSSLIKDPFILVNQIHGYVISEKDVLEKNYDNMWETFCIVGTYGLTEADINDLAKKESRIAEIKQLTEDKFKEEILPFMNKGWADWVQVEPSFKRKGVATALYCKALEFLQSKGVILIRSKLQRPEGKSMWDGFKAKKLAVEEGGELVFKGP